MWVVTGATGHIGNVLVRELLTRGESYILSGQRITVRYLLETVREITGLHFFQMKEPFNSAMPKRRVN